jgi:hypothetical protein
MLTRLHNKRYTETRQEPGKIFGLAEKIRRAVSTEIHNMNTPGSAITCKSGFPVEPHLSTQYSCSPVRESTGPNEDRTVEKILGNRRTPRCGVAMV